jgi:hypothetical protein
MLAVAVHFLPGPTASFQRENGRAELPKR